MKFALFAFRKEPMCFIHVLLYALQLNKFGYEVKVVLEGESTSLIPELYKEDTPFYTLFKSCLERDLIGGVCKACSMKFGTYEVAKEKGLTILEDMANHAGMAPFIEKGYSIITF
ncbi:MAG: cytoplasmic protein [Thermodesulfobacteriaceae bacterium]|jgi:hypothetical protein